MRMVLDARVRLIEVIEKEEKGKEMEMEGGEGKEREREREREDNEKKDGNVASATATRAPPNQVLGPQAVHHTSPENLKVAKNSAPLAIMHRRTTAIDKYVKAQCAKIPLEAPQRPQRRSMRILESVQKHAQDKLTITSIEKEEQSPVMAGPVEKVIVEGLSGQVAQGGGAKAEMGKEKEATIKIKCPILKPKAGAGVVKRAVVRGLRGRFVEKAKGSVEMGKEVENRSIAPSTTTDKVTGTHPARNPSEVLHGPQRRSMRIIESMQKSARRGKETAVDALAEGEIGEGNGLVRQIAVAVPVDVKSQIMKPRAGAGVQKRRGRGRSSGGLSGKPPGDKKQTI